MNSVFLLYEDNGCGYDVVGVYSTQKKADDKMEELDAKSYQRRYVDEVELDSEILV